MVDGWKMPQNFGDMINAWKIPRIFELSTGKSSKIAIASLRSAKGTKFESIWTKLIQNRHRLASLGKGRKI
jgi:hypothetical protein